MNSAGCTVPLLLAAALAAQAPAPDPHWGARMFPALEPELRANVSFNRFTQFDKTGRAYSDRIDESAGFNVLHLSLTENFPGLPKWFYTFSGGLGYSDEQPTRFFQNDFVHDLLGLRPIPANAERDEPEYVAGASRHRAFDGPRLFRGGPLEDDEAGWRTGFFLGGGLATGTIYHEPYLEAGGSLLVPRTWLTRRRLRVRLMHRLGFPKGSSAYPQVAPNTNTTQAAIALVPERIESQNAILQFLGNPELEVTLTRDTGLFLDSDGDPRTTWFFGARVKWATGLTFETWNDIANGTDWGPSYGFLLGIDVTTFFNNAKLKW